MSDPGVVLNDKLAICEEMCRRGWYALKNGTLAKSAFDPYLNMAYIAREGGPAWKKDYEEAHAALHAR